MIDGLLYIHAFIIIPLVHSANPNHNILCAFNTRNLENSTS